MAVPRLEQKQNVQAGLDMAHIAPARNMLHYVHRQNKKHQTGIAAVNLGNNRSDAR